MDELEKDRAEMCQRFLAEKDINVSLKDIARVIRHAFPIASPDGEYYDHREIYLVELQNGERYEIMRETVNESGAFSLDSAKMITRTVRRYEGGEV